MFFTSLQVGSNRGDCGLVNDVVTEDFQQHEGHVLPSPPQQSQQQHRLSQSGPVGATASVVASGGTDMNVSMDDESLSSMASSKHSFNSLPKGNQIHSADQRPDLLK